MDLSNVRSVIVNAYGQQRRVELGRRREDGSWSARVRMPGTGNSVRGTLRQTSMGLRFKATNPSLIS